MLYSLLIAALLLSLCGKVQGATWGNEAIKPNDNDNDVKVFLKPSYVENSNDPPPYELDYKGNLFTKGSDKINSIRVPNGVKVSIWNTDCNPCNSPSDRRVEFLDDVDYIDRGDLKYIKISKYSASETPYLYFTTLTPGTIRIRRARAYTTDDEISKNADDLEGYSVDNQDHWPRQVCLHKGLIATFFSGKNFDGDYFELVGDNQCKFLSTVLINDEEVNWSQRIRSFRLVRIKPEDLFVEKRGQWKLLGGYNFRFTRKYEIGFELTEGTENAVETAREFEQSIKFGFQYGPDASQKTAEVELSHTSSKAVTETVSTSITKSKSEETELSCPEEVEGVASKEGKWMLFIFELTGKEWLSQQTITATTGQYLCYHEDDPRLNAEGTPVCPPGFYYRPGTRLYTELEDCARKSDNLPDPGEDGNSNVGEPSTGEPSTGKPNTGKPSTGEPSTGEPSTGKPNTGKPSTEEKADPDNVSASARMSGSVLGLLALAIAM